MDPTTPAFRNVLPAVPEWRVGANIARDERRGDTDDEVTPTTR
jgi:hypothetical protein